MRLFSRTYLTGMILLAYIIGGALVPVAHHHHDHENCGHTHDLNDSLTQESSHESCPFGHAHCHEVSSQSPSSDGSYPTTPHDDCAACRLLYMTTTAVEYVSLPVCCALIADTTLHEVAYAVTGDIALPTKRGPPAFV